MCPSFQQQEVSAQHHQFLEPVSAALFLLQHLDTIVLLPYLIVRAPKKLFTHSWDVGITSQSCAGQVL